MDQFTIENNVPVIVVDVPAIDFDLDLHLDVTMGETRSSHAA